MTGSEIARIVGLKPHLVFDVGAQRKTPKGQLLKGLYDRTYCLFELFEGLDSSLIDKIRATNKHLLKRRRGLRKIKLSGGVLEYYVDFMVYGNAGVNFEPDILQEVSQVYTRISVDVWDSWKTGARRSKRK
jgi:hypothetical protein